MKKNRRSILYFLLTVLAVVASIFMIYIWRERFSGKDNKPVIICPTESISVSVDSMSDESILLRDVTAIDVEDGDITASIVVESVSQFVEEGHCIVTYAAFDSAKNVSKLTRHLFFTDYVSPKFKITAPLEFNYSSVINPLSVIRAYDCIDGDISERIKMSLKNPDDELSSVGAHMVEFKVTNSLGDVSVLETEIDVFDRTYTETRMTPVIVLEDYITYVECYDRIDPMSMIEGVTVGGVFYKMGEFSEDTLSIDASDVNYSKPGVYRILYTCTNKEYIGSVVLIVVVSEVSR